MTLPAPSAPDTTPDHPPARQRDRFSPSALLAVVGVGALVIILCGLGVTMSGMFDLFASDDAATEAAPTRDELKALPTGPAQQVDDGQYLVQRDILPGTYTATVPAGSAGCTWERNASTDGTASSVLESGQGSTGERIVVNIKDTDKVFQSQGCGIWQRTSD
ncbi:MAG TPA: hypothetical protein VF163_22340 [Micromonosporaceae bacterium]